MRRPRYPLDTVAELRDRKVDGAVQALAGNVKEREQAEARRQQREREQQSLEAHVGAVAQAERGALERGELSAADLARAHAWQLRADAERAAARAQVAQSVTHETQARAAEHAARDEVGARRADAEVIAKDRARWTAERAKQADAKEEESAAEAFRPRR